MERGRVLRAGHVLPVWVGVSDRVSCRVLLSVRVDGDATAVSVRYEWLCSRTGLDWIGLHDCLRDAKLLMLMIECVRHLLQRSGADVCEQQRGVQCGDVLSDGRIGSAGVSAGQVLSMDGHDVVAAVSWRYDCMIEWIRWPSDLIAR